MTRCWCAGWLADGSSPASTPSNRAHLFPSHGPVPPGRHSPDRGRQCRTKTPPSRDRCALTGKYGEGPNGYNTCNLGVAKLGVTCPAKIQYLDKNGFKEPTNISTVSGQAQYLIGNAPRSLAYGVRNPYTWNVDASMRRTFPLIQGRRGHSPLKPTALTCGTTSPSATQAQLGPTIHQPSATSPAHQATVTGSLPDTSTSNLKPSCIRRNPSAADAGFTLNSPVLLKPFRSERPDPRKEIAVPLAVISSLHQAGLFTAHQRCPIGNHFAENCCNLMHNLDYGQSAIQSSPYSGLNCKIAR